MEYTIKTKRDGMQAESRFVLGECKNENGKDGTRVLQVTTSKNGKSLVTLASVHVETKEEGYTSQSFVMFQDYMKRIAVIPCARISEKALRNAHESALAHDVPRIMPDVLAQYSLESAV